MAMTPNFSLRILPEKVHPGMMAPSCHPSAWDAEAGILQSEFQASLSSRSHPGKEKKGKEWQAEKGC